MTREEALSYLKNLTLKKFSKKIKKLNLPKKRVQEFYDVVIEKTSINSISQFDIQEFALKSIFKKGYDEFKTKHHPLSTGELYEFDPAKNGQNLVKHGVSFIEIVSYSKRFGTLNIPCPDINDRERIISFSDFDLENKYNPDFPLSEIEGVRYCISIVKSINGKFRFISSRFLSSKKKKYTDTIYQSLRSVNFSDESSKTDFVDYAVWYLEKNLMIHPT